MIKSTFDTYFARWSIVLPDESITARSRGELRQSGWIITYLFGRAGEREYLDFYASHRMTNDRHLRIYGDGEVVQLEAIQDMYGWKPDALGAQEEAERAYVEHNRRVAKQLRDKGF